MQEVNLELLKQYAHDLMFDIDDCNLEQTLIEFKIAQKQIAMIEEIKDLDEEEPMTFPFDCAISYLREDEVGEHLSCEEALKNAKDVYEGQIKLPKVVG